MKLSEAPQAYTFDDFNLIPVRSAIRSRKIPDIVSSVAEEKLQIPIISAPMNTITEWEMAFQMSTLGADSVLHRYMTVEDQCNQFKKIHLFEGTFRRPWVAVGATGDYLERAEALYNVGARKFCIDIANGHSELCIEAVKRLRVGLPQTIKIMAGNVCSYEGAHDLVNAGAHVLRVGIGGGSACSTRLVTGFGVPQLSAIEDCMRVKQTTFWHKETPYIVADGGVRGSGDVVKCFAMGVDAVMVGGLLAASSHTPGKIVEDIHGQQSKRYAGMASKEGRDGFFEREQTNFVPEGVAFDVKYKGNTEKIVSDLAHGLKVGMSYAGALNLKELSEKAKWVRVTDNGRREGNPNRKLHS
jgi:IMP dehydrogenase